METVLGKFADNICLVDFKLDNGKMLNISYIAFNIAVEGFYLTCLFICFKERP